MFRDNIQTTIKVKKRLLQELLEKWYNLQFDVKRQLMFRYDFLFGDLEDEVENKYIEKSILEIKNKVYSRQLNMPKEGLESFLNDLNNRAKKRNQEFAKRILPDRLYILRRNYKENIIDTSKGEEDINYLYKQLVKRLHPDMADNTDENRNLWDKMQNSYKVYDIVRLKMLFLLTCYEVDNDLQDNKKASAFLAKLEKYIEIQQNDLKNLKEEEPFCFAEKIENKEWIKERKKELQDRSLQLSVKIIKQRNKTAS
ncbi:MAG: hypothetical protein GX372_02805 [Ignavibacteria bacterium]|jgi:hypothetical protein|nr:hypothetical protein [Ignavibacteria bacterium]